MKLETYLRMTGLPFEIARRASHMKAPKGKLPYIEDNGRRIGDSGFIVDHLKRTYGDPLDADLSATERATALGLRRLMEENLYWAMVYSRWVDPEGWRLTKQVFFAQLPAPLRWTLPTLARRGIRRQLAGHGIGRHSAEEVYEIGKADITGLADFLGDKPYFMGDEPASIDAVAYAFIANLIWVPIDSPLKQHAARFSNLEAYCQRMKARYFAGAP